MLLLVCLLVHMPFIRLYMLLACSLMMLLLLTSIIMQLLVLLVLLVACTIMQHLLHLLQLQLLGHMLLLITGMLL